MVYRTGWIGGNREHVWGNLNALHFGPMEIPPETPTGFAIEQKTLKRQPA